MGSLSMNSMASMTSFMPMSWVLIALGKSLEKRGSSRRIWPIGSSCGVNEDYGWVFFDIMGQVEAARAAIEHVHAGRKWLVFKALRRMDTNALVAHEVVSNAKDE